MPLNATPKKSSKKTRDSSDDDSVQKCNAGLLTDAQWSIDDRHLGLSAAEQRRNAKVAHLLSSAAQILVRDGHAKLSLRAVASEAGIGLSSLQHYFESRDLLLRETVRAIISNWLVRYEEIRRNRNLSGAEILKSIIEDVVTEAEKPHVCGFFLEVWTMARHDLQAGDLLAELYRRYRALLKDLILEINPHLPEPEADAMATMISALSEGLMVMSHHGGALRTPASTLRSMMQLIWPLASQLGLEGMADQVLQQSDPAGS